MRALNTKWGAKMKAPLYYSVDPNPASPPTAEQVYALIVAIGSGVYTEVYPMLSPEVQALLVPQYAPSEQDQ